MSLMSTVKRLESHQKQSYREYVVYFNYNSSFSAGFAKTDIKGTFLMKELVDLHRLTQEGGETRTCTQCKRAQPDRSSLV